MTPLPPLEDDDELAPFSAVDALRVDERHAGDVGAVEAALRSAGLEVEALDLDPEREGDRRTRLAFGVDPATGGVGCLVVLTPARRASSVESPSVLGSGHDSVPVLVARLDDAPAIEAAAATNDEVRRVVELVTSLEPGARDALLGVVRHAERRLRQTLGRPEVARRADVLDAVDLLEAVASGTPAEWALRHHWGSSR